MFPFGSIVLIRFPFTDLSGDERRPALVVSARGDATDVIVCFMTSVQRPEAALPMLPAAPSTGLKQASGVRFDKVATLDVSLITGRIRKAPTDWLRDQLSRFFAAFGFPAR